MANFNTVVLEGVFYRDADGFLTVQTEQGNQFVDYTLHQFENQEVQLAMHHLPKIPLIPDQWGGGCCHWQASGKCPAGHHEHPSFLLSVSERGILRHVLDKWFLETFEGTKVILPLHLMEGHTGRLAIVTIVNLEKLRESLSQMDTTKTEIVSIQAKQLQGVLGQLQETLKGIS